MSVTENFAEFAIIASIIQHPHILKGVRESLKGFDFLRKKNCIVYRAICELDDTGIIPTSDTILQHLLTAGDIDKIGGVSGLAEMIDGIPRSNDVSHLIRMVRRLSCDHQARAISEYISGKIEDGEQPLEVFREQLPRLTELLEPAKETTDKLVDTLGCSGLDLDGDETAPINWIAYGYVALGALTEIIARVKIGKTTFIMALIRACLSDGDFLGHYVKPCKVLMITEQGRVSFKAQAGKAGIIGFENLTVIFKYELTPFTWEQRIDLVMKKAIKVGAQLVIWDTFSRLACLKDDGENSEEAGRKMSDLADAAAATGLAIVPLRHGRKAGGDASDAGRGYSGISGAVDIIIHLKQSTQGEHLREIETKSRFDETPETAVIELAGQHYRLLGDTGSIRHDRSTTKILDCLPTIEREAFTLEAARNASGVKRESARRILKELSNAGKISTKGNGVCGSPFVWWKSAKVYQNGNSGKTIDNSTDTAGNESLPEHNSSRVESVVDRLSNGSKSVYQEPNSQELADW